MLVVCRHMLPLTKATGNQTMIRVNSLGKKFIAHNNKSITALQDVTFALEAGEFFTLLGPSGCGKTTTLRSIAGFEWPDCGEIWLGKNLVYSSAARVAVPCEQREIGIVFQSYAIWPHMTVFQNVAFPLIEGRKRERSKERVKKRVMEMLEMTGLADMADRPVPFLSGGQQQRVALARALVAESKILLLDEPLSNLDAKLREIVRRELCDMVKRVGATALYVTHDQLEALTMSDRVAVMNNGEILQQDRPERLYRMPQSHFVASFIGSANFIRGHLKALDANQMGMVATSIGNLSCTVFEGCAVGDVVELLVRPEEIRLFATLPFAPITNVVEGIVGKIVFRGETSECTLSVNNVDLSICVPWVTPTPGASERFYIDPSRCRALPLDGSRSAGAWTLQAPEKLAATVSA